MRIQTVVFAALIAFCYSAKIQDPKPAPRFALVGERSINGVPTVSVTFPNGHEDTLILDRHYSFEEDRIGQVEACNYIGHLEKDPEACVAMTGCVGSEDVEFTILSDHATESPMFKWTKEDTVEVIEHPYLHSSKTDRMWRNQTTEDDMTDDDINAKLLVAEEFCSGGSCTLPAAMEMQIRVGYDKRFRDKTGGKSGAEKYIKDTLVHVQAYFCHESLGTRIKVTLLSMPYYPDKEILATYQHRAAMFSTTTNDLGSADLMVYMGYKGTKSSSIGIAHIGSICRPKSFNKEHEKQCLNIWDEKISYAAQTIAHEVGHNLGMHHDFASGGGNGGNNKPNQGASSTDCDGEGLMSYDPAPNKWSSCSQKNLKVQYQSIGAANWCLASSGGDCQDKPAWASNCPGWAAQFCSHSFWGSWMATNCKKSCNKCDAPEIVKICKGEKGCAAVGGNESWKNDMWCDDINNNEACGWDGGACCNNSQSGWDNYCYLCQCLDPSKTFSHNGHVAGSKPV